MGQDVAVPGGYNPVGQGMGRYQEGTAPQIGADFKAKGTPAMPGGDLAGLSGLPGPSPAPDKGMDPNMLKTLIASLLQRGGRR